MAEANMLVKIGSDAASDSWGFVGVVTVGEVEAYRTLEAFASPAAATEATANLVADLMGELLAGREWRAVRDDKGKPPTREDFNFSALSVRRPDGSG